MAYGFYLTGVQMPLNIPYVMLTLSDGTNTNTYKLNYDDTEEPLYIAHLENDGYIIYGSEGDEDSRIISTLFTSDDVGDEYTINLSTPEAPTQAFKEAVEMVTEAIQITLPDEFKGIIMNGLQTYKLDIIQADGKPCMVPTIRWSYLDATDENGFITLFNSIHKTVLNKSRVAYIGNVQIIIKTEGSHVAEIEYNEINSAEQMYFTIHWKFAACGDVDSSDTGKYIDCNAVISLISVLSST